MAYTVFHLGEPEAIPSFELLVIEDEAELQRRLQRAFAERSYCQALEVWRGDEPLFTIERPGC